MSLYRDGHWRQVNAEEMVEFMKINREFSKLLTDPNFLKNLKIPTVPPSVTIYDHWDKAAIKIIHCLWKIDGALNFHSPVDYVTLRIPDYPSIIKRPMDLGTIKKKLLSYSYKNCKEFVDDVELVFTNCIVYNGESSDFGILALNMKNQFRKLCQEFSLNYYMKF